MSRVAQKIFGSAPRCCTHRGQHPELRQCRAEDGRLGRAQRQHRCRRAEAWPQAWPRRRSSLRHRSRTATVQGGAAHRGAPPDRPQCIAAQLTEECRHGGARVLVLRRPPVALEAAPTRGGLLAREHGRRPHRRRAASRPRRVQRLPAVLGLAGGSRESRARWQSRPKTTLGNDTDYTAASTSLYCIPTPRRNS